MTLVDLKEVVRGEFAENAFRKDFLPSEIDAIRRAIEPLEKTAAKERQKHHGGTAPGRKHSGKVSRSDGRTRNKIGAFRGDEMFFNLAVSLRRAGMNLGQIEMTLRTEAQFGRSPKERLSQIPSITKSLRRYFVSAT